MELARRQFALDRQSLQRRCLPQAQSAALAKAAAAVGHDNAVSVLVRGSPGRSADDYGGDAVVRLFTFQAS